MMNNSIRGEVSNRFIIITTIIAVLFVGVCVLAFYLYPHIYKAFHPERRVLVWEDDFERESTLSEWKASGGTFERFSNPRTTGVGGSHGNVLVADLSGSGMPIDYFIHELQAEPPLDIEFDIYIMDCNARMPSKICFLVGFTSDGSPENLRPIFTVFGNMSLGIELDKPMDFKIKPKSWKHFRVSLERVKEKYRVKVVLGSQSWMREEDLTDELKKDWKDLSIFFYFVGNGYIDNVRVYRKTNK